MALTQKHCVSSEGGMQAISKREAQEYHREIPEWTLHQKSIERELRFKSFKESMAFVAKVAAIAEEEGHYPDITIFFGRVKLQLTTHVIGGLTDNDFIVAAKIDRLLTE